MFFTLVCPRRRLDQKKEKETTGEGSMLGKAIEEEEEDEEEEEEEVAEALLEVQRGVQDTDESLFQGIGGTLGGLFD